MKYNYHFTEEQKQFIRDWVAALRSGTYRQCKGVLNDGAGMCCLGVATDLFIKLKPGIINWVEVVEDGRVVFAASDDPDKEKAYLNTTYLPYAVSSFVGFSTGTPKVHVDFEDDRRTPLDPDREFLSNMNDSGFTFEQIATYIEREFLDGPTPSDSV